MSHHDIYDAGFTEGYAGGTNGDLRQLGAPLELVLLMPAKINHWREGYEQGFAKGKADRRSLLAQRETLRAEELAHDAEHSRDV